MYYSKAAEGYLINVWRFSPNSRAPLGGSVEPPDNEHHALALPQEPHGTRGAVFPAPEMYSAIGTSFGGCCHEMVSPAQ